MRNPDNPSNPRDEVRDDAMTNLDTAPRENDEAPAPTQYSPEMGSVVVTRHRADEEHQ